MATGHSLQRHKIELAAGRQASITVRHGDSPYQLASDFVASEGLSGGETTTRRLAKLIRTKVEKVNFTINNDQDSGSEGLGTKRDDSRESPTTRPIPRPASARSPNRASGRTNSAGGKTPTQVITNGMSSDGDESPFSAPASTHHQQSRPVGEMSIKVSRAGKMGKIVIHKGDDAHMLVSNFCKMYPGALTSRQAHQVIDKITAKLRPSRSPARTAGGSRTEV